MDDKDIIQYLTPFLSLKSLNTLIKTSKRFAKYKDVVREITEPDRDVYVNTNNQKVEVVKYYKRPIVKSNKHYKAGKLHGEFKVWYPNGKLRLLTFYQNGKREGEFKMWHANGQPESFGFQKDGKWEGEYKEWYPDGQIRQLESFKNGKLHGEFKLWYADGRLQFQCFYDNGKLKGEYKEWLSF